MSRALGIVARLVWEGDFGGSVFCELIKVFPLFVERIDGLLGDIGVFHLVESQSTRPFVVGQFGVRLFPLVVKNPADKKELALRVTLNLIGKSFDCSVVLRDCVFPGRSNIEDCGRRGAASEEQGGKEKIGEPFHQPSFYPAWASGDLLRAQSQSVGTQGLPFSSQDLKE
jgi:hypothetical protein